MALDDFFGSFQCQNSMNLQFNLQLVLRFAGREI